MELHSMELYLKFHFHKYFHYTHQLIHQLFFFFTYNFYNLNILQLCLLLETPASNLHLHLQVLCRFMCLVSLVLDMLFL